MPSAAQVVESLNEDKEAAAALTTDRVGKPALGSGTGTGHAAASGRGAPLGILKPSDILAELPLPPHEGRDSKKPEEPAPGGGRDSIGQRSINLETRRSKLPKAR